MIDAKVLTENEKVQIEEIPTLNHSFTCVRILRQLLTNETIEALPELTLAIGNGLTPDISVYQKEQIQPNFLEDVTRVEIPPVLAIEIISPSQDIQYLLGKAKVFVQAGVKTAWTVEPFTQTVFVTTENGTKIMRDTTIESEGIAVDFGKVFGG